MIEFKAHLLQPASIVVVALLVACGAPHNPHEGTKSPAAAVRDFPTFPGAIWDGDITAQEEDGQLTWIVSWTAPAAESEVRLFFIRTLGESGWHLSQGDSAHEFRLLREEFKLRGYLRLGKPEFGESGIGVTLGIRDPKLRQKGCLKALPWLPSYPGAEVRGCTLVHIPGARSFSLLAATHDDVALANQTLSNALLSTGWTREPGILGVLVFRHEGGAREAARIIWGPDPSGSLPTGFLLSIDLPETALSELPQ